MFCCEPERRSITVQSHWRYGPFGSQWNSVEQCVSSLLALSRQNYDKLPLFRNKLFTGAVNLKQNAYKVAGRCREEYPNLSMTQITMINNSHSSATFAAFEARAPFWNQSYKADP